MPANFSDPRFDVWLQMVLTNNCDLPDRFSHFSWFRKTHAWVCTQTNAINKLKSSFGPHILHFNLDTIQTRKDQ